MIALIKIELQSTDYNASEIDHYVNGLFGLRVLKKKFGNPSKSYLISAN